MFEQASYDLRFAWGPAGLAALAPNVDVIVDVLSFSTCVDIAAVAKSYAKEVSRKM